MSSRADHARTAAARSGESTAVADLPVARRAARCATARRFWRSSAAASARQRCGVAACASQRLQRLLAAQQVAAHLGRGIGGQRVHLVLHARVFVAAPSAPPAASAPPPAAGTSALHKARRRRRRWRCTACGERRWRGAQDDVPLGAAAQAGAVLRATPAAGATQFRAWPAAPKQRTLRAAARLARRAILESAPPRRTPHAFRKTAPCPTTKTRPPNCAGRARIPRVPDARQAGHRRDQADGQPARPGAGLFARRGRGLRGDRRRPGQRLPLHRARQPGGGDHQRHRGAGPGRHRPAGRQAGDGRQGGAVQEVRRHRRLRHRGQREEPRQAGRRDRRAGAHLRRHQPGGHQGAGLLRTSSASCASA